MNSAGKWVKQIDLLLTAVTFGAASDAILIDTEFVVDVTTHEMNGG